MSASHIGLYNPEDEKVFPWTSGYVLLLSLIGAPTPPRHPPANVQKRLMRSVVRHKTSLMPGQRWSRDVRQRNGQRTLSNAGNEPGRITQ
ncbi:hypothetical protein NDU88_007397 [Pleurodeles waltl]|uniref:Uncharacterized protein n=1 Tax=Pleurodeles waltl TaxID=8319 RepID=A0AAV7U0C0_PLEWA|nr:hypothetical protein NDU88_007397 [Pleurodeles waltl]